RDGQGTRLTYLKVTGGTLRVKSLLTNRRPGLGEDQVWEEKADQIRIYSGAKFRTVEEAPAGTVCAVTGLSRSRAGEGLGLE
ncbi:Transcriptional regulator, partial [Dysosmobacter welbionis]